MQLFAEHVQDSLSDAAQLPSGAILALGGIRTFRAHEKGREVGEPDRGRLTVEVSAEAGHAKGSVRPVEGVFAAPFQNVKRSGRLHRRFDSIGR